MRRAGLDYEISWHFHFVCASNPVTDKPIDILPFFCCTNFFNIKDNKKPHCVCFHFQGNSDITNWIRHHNGKMIINISKVTWKEMIIVIDILKVWLWINCLLKQDFKFSLIRREDGPYSLANSGLWAMIRYYWDAFIPIIFHRFH